MILYNVMVNIEESVHDEWLDWMTNKHVPDVMKTGLFTEYKIFRILDVESDGGVTYSIQYFCNSLDDYEKYQEEYAPILQKEHSGKYKDKFVAFRTIMESV
jgi:hypothetical protein